MHTRVVGDRERVASGRVSGKLEARLESEREIEPASIKAALASTGRVRFIDGVSRPAAGQPPSLCTLAMSHRVIDVAVQSRSSSPIANV